MGIRLDFSDVDVGSFEALPDGTYSGVIASVQQEVGKKSKKPYLKVTIKLDENPEMGVKKGRQVWSNFSLQPQSLWVLKQLLIRLGWSKDELEGEFDLDPADLIGQECVAKLGPSDPGYNGNNVLDVFNSEHHVGQAEGAASF